MLVRLSHATLSFLDMLHLEFERSVRQEIFLIRFRNCNPIRPRPVVPVARELPDAGGSHGATIYIPVPGSSHCLRLHIHFDTCLGGGAPQGARSLLQGRVDATHRRDASREWPTDHRNDAGRSTPTASPEP